MKGTTSSPRLPRERGECVQHVAYYCLTVLRIQSWVFKHRFFKKSVGICKQVKKVQQAVDIGCRSARVVGSELLIELIYAE